MKQPKCGSEVKAKLQPAGPTSRFLGASWPGERSIKCAGVVELVDTQDLGSCAFGCEGSSPSFGTPDRAMRSVGDFRSLAQDSARRRHPHSVRQ